MCCNNSRSRRLFYNILKPYCRDSPLSHWSISELKHCRSLSIGQRSSSSSECLMGFRSSFYTHQLCSSTANWGKRTQGHVQACPHTFGHTVTARQAKGWVWQPWETSVKTNLSQVTHLNDWVEPLSLNFGKISFTSLVICKRELCVFSVFWRNVLIDSYHLNTPVTGWVTLLSV